MPERYRKRGETVVVRDVHQGALRAAVAMTVVEDGPQRTLLYLGRGYPFRLPADSAGRLTKDPDAARQLVRLHWEGFEQLSITSAGEAHGVIVRWTWPERQFVEWYVNLQAPLVRTNLGFDSTDHALDVLIAPNRDQWHWKDEAQLDELVRTGYFSAAEAAGFRAEGERVVERAKAGLPPFNEPWPDWRPDPAWTVPNRPEGWDRL